MKSVLEDLRNAEFSVVSFQHLNTFEVRSKQKIPQNCQSAIAFVFPYYNKCTSGGNISAYCAVSDYHLLVMQQLKSISAQLEQKYPHYSFVPFVDASPIDEVDMAAKGGLGVKGKNSLLITPRWGSFVFIGEILTDMPLKAILHPVEYCMDCGRCKAACPGGATGDGAVDKERCASFISQKKQEITVEQTQILKKAKTVFGCDICQLVCPHNSGVLQSDEINIFSDDILHTVTKENVQQIYKERAFGFRGLKVLQRNLEIFEEQEE